MTAPSVREQLAEALRAEIVAGLPLLETPSDVADATADVLAPLVERIAAEAAASELEKAAADPKLVGIRSSAHRGDTAAWLRARAAAVRSQSHTDTNGDQA